MELRMANEKLLTSVFAVRYPLFAIPESVSAMSALQRVHFDPLRTLGAGLVPGGPAQAPTD